MTKPAMKQAFVPTQKRHNGGHNGGHNDANVLPTSQLTKDKNVCENMKLKKFAKTVFSGSRIKSQARRATAREEKSQN